MQGQRSPTVRSRISDRGAVLPSLCLTRRRPARGQVSPLVSQASTVVSPASSVVSPHPDAIKRRLEADERALKRQEELNREQLGHKWWREDGHVRLLSSPEELQRTIETNHGILVINFFSEECYSCKTLHPKLKRIAESNLGEVTFVKINGSDPAFQPTFHSSGITAVPWFHMYVDTELSASLSASLNPERLQRFRDQIATLRNRVDQRRAADCIYRVK